VSDLEVEGIRIGHWTHQSGKTGCTVILMPPGGAVTSAEVRGGAPGTRETDLLIPGMLVEKVDAVVFTGGSAFGLAAADGVVEFLREHNRGIEFAGFHIPIVSGAVIFDLNVSEGRFPDFRSGYMACKAAIEDGPLAVGRVGAGAGATVGKLLGYQFHMPGGVGTAELQTSTGAHLFCLSVVNCAGDVYNWEGQIVAGARSGDGKFLNITQSYGKAMSNESSVTNTTLVIVLSDAILTKQQCHRLAQRAHDGLAIAIRPAHTMYDGDIAFCSATCKQEVDFLELEILVPILVARAIANAVTN